MSSEGSEAKPPVATSAKSGSDRIIENDPAQKQPVSADVQSGSAQVLVEEVAAVATTNRRQGSLLLYIRAFRVQLLPHGPVVWVWMAFAAALAIALVVTWVAFPPRRLLNPAYWTLAFSVYAGAFTGLVVSIVERAQYNSNKVPSNWTSTSGFILYNTITGLVGMLGPVVVSCAAILLYLLPAPVEPIAAIDRNKLAEAAGVGLQNSDVVGSLLHAEAFKKILALIDQPTFGRSILEIVSYLSDEALHKVIVVLAVAASAVIVAYTLADCVAYRGGGDKPKYRQILYMDVFVIIIHALALWVLHLNEWFPMTFGFATGPRDAFMGGCMALSLVLQSGWFAYIMSRPITSGHEVVDDIANLAGNRALGNVQPRGSQ